MTISLNTLSHDEIHELAKKIEHNDFWTVEHPDATPLDVIACELVANAYADCDFIRINAAKLKEHKKNRMMYAYKAACARTDEETRKQRAYERAAASTCREIVEQIHNRETQIRHGLADAVRGLSPIVAFFDEMPMVVEVGPTDEEIADLLDANFETHGVIAPCSSAHIPMDSEDD